MDDRTGITALHARQRALTPSVETVITGMYCFSNRDACKLTPSAGRRFHRVLLRCTHCQNCNAKASSRDPVGNSASKVR